MNWIELENGIKAGEGQLSWKYFTENELKCSASGKCEMNSDFMDKLVRLREKYGKSMIISSGYRDKDEHPIESAKSRPGAHSLGRAVDVVCYGGNALRLAKLAARCGFTGIGVKQSGELENRFIHLDDLARDELDGFPRPWIWSY